MVACRRSIMMKVQLFAILAIVAFVGSASCHTEEENFAYIKSILNLLNNDEQCLLPTYDEIDNLLASFVELESALGSEALEAKLGPDERLLKKTILDQWLSFQESMNPAVVIRLAKHRAFLYKIESYQSAKFGSSICTKVNLNRKSFTRDFEKNPIVRYVSNMEMEDVPSGSEHNQLDRIDLTPVDPDNSNEHESRKILQQLVNDIYEEPTTTSTTELPETTTTTTTKAPEIDRKPVIKNPSMSLHMQDEAVKTAQTALEKFESHSDIAEFIKKEFDRKFRRTWNCIVGPDFGSYVSFERENLIYFYLGDLGILLFKSV